MKILTVQEQSTRTCSLFKVCKPKQVYLRYPLTKSLILIFLPAEANLMPGPLEARHFLPRKPSAMLKNEVGSADHKGKRLSARRNYLKAARCQESRCQRKLKKVVKLFCEGNTVSVNIYYTYRTKTGAQLLPCKVSESKTVDDFVLYKVNILFLWYNQKLIPWCGTD